MKAAAVFFIVFFTVLALSEADISDIPPRYSGQPGCKTQEELQVRIYRHFKKKIAYWECTQLGVPATLRFCPYETGYLDAAKDCVSWRQWYWTPTVAPPSSP
ncbi:uncharacterized protein LOC142222662 [Haematobia irritans]|uniref:uncharacterized protein LOC142222662 n=1 Tax=Haematobia irritans TaxID=7368 RepID=UPI003F4F98D0